jgi:hypothetical protein
LASAIATSGVCDLDRLRLQSDILFQRAKTCGTGVTQRA